MAQPASGVLAQLVERLNGIEEVRGSNPLGSTPGLAHSSCQIGENLKNLSTTSSGPLMRLGGALEAEPRMNIQRYPFAGNLIEKIIVWIEPTRREHGLHRRYFY